MNPSPDPLGHELLTRRLADIPGILAAMLAGGPAPLRPTTLAARRFIVTGTGSSEAHARYLVMLLNLYTERAAAFLPLSGFVDSPPGAFAGRTLVVWSQGVSPTPRSPSAAAPISPTPSFLPPPLPPPPSPPASPTAPLSSNNSSTTAATSSSSPSPRNTPRSSASSAPSPATSPPSNSPPPSAAAASPPPPPPISFRCSPPNRPPPCATP